MSQEPEINLVELAHFSKSVEAGIVKELLENNGVSVIIRGLSLSDLMPGGSSEVTLLVPEEDLERAGQLYDAFFERQAEEVLPEDVELPEQSSEESA